MGEDLLTTLSMENHHPSTVLSMDSSGISYEELDRDANRSVILSLPPDINLPLSVERSPPPPGNLDTFDMLDVFLGPQINTESDTTNLLNVSRHGRKSTNRLDNVWGAWFFFSYYFKPKLNETSKCKLLRDENGVSGFDKSDLQLDSFLVQHDMENIYMWVFKERPQNALGKMQLRSYMNGHSRLGERPFPFSVDKGFVRSHRMQRKHYRGLSNPQCLHGIELVPNPNLVGIDEEDQTKWVELTGRDFNFAIPKEAVEFCSWRNLPSTEFELERPLPSLKPNPHKKFPNGSGLNLLAHSLHHVNGNGNDPSHGCKKRKKDNLLHGNEEDCSLVIGQHTDKNTETLQIEPLWVNDFAGVMRNVNGPVTAAKTIYEDDQGYLIVISLPFVDLTKVKVTWWNTLTHGIVKISSVSTSCMPFVKRNERTFKLTDVSPEHCPPGEFIREISLPARIPDDAKLEAYGDKTGTGLEILVPKHRMGPEEHEVRVCLRPVREMNEL